MQEQSPKEMAKEPSGQPPRRGGPNFVRGTSGNPRGRESNASRRARRLALIVSWAAPYGGVDALRPAELSLLDVAAEIALRGRPRSAEDATRRANTISKILAQTGLAHKDRGPRKASEPAPRPVLDPAAQIAAVVAEAMKP